MSVRESGRPFFDLEGLFPMATVCSEQWWNASGFHSKKFQVKLSVIQFRAVCGSWRQLLYKNKKVGQQQQKEGLQAEDRNAKDWQIMRQSGYLSERFRENR